jgi:pyruvate/2-oxoglutarate dehydrogenase complex dihydrolipoamide acyltransferase (E2) component
MISSLGNFGCETTVVPTPLTAYLTFGPIARDGKVAVGLNVDHRVMDGRDAARALEDVERILGTVILGELRRLAANTAQEVPALPSSSPSSFATV